MVDIGQSVQILGNLDVIGGLVFVAAEIRTNTATNQIAVYQTASANWIQASAQIATNEELAELVAKAYSGQSLTDVETLRLSAWRNEQLSRGTFARRLFEAGLFSESDFRMELESALSLVCPRLGRSSQRCQTAVIAITSWPMMTNSKDYSQTWGIESSAVTVGLGWTPKS